MHSNDYTMGSVGPASIAEGKIRARVGEFLGLRQRLQKLLLVLDSKITSEANKLLTIQKDLEERLPGAVDASDNIFDLGNMFTTISFASAMENQIKDVKVLEAKASGKPVQKLKFWQKIKPLDALKIVGLILLARKLLK